MKGNQLNLQLGFSHDINFEIPTDIKVIVDFNDWSHLKQFYEPKVSIPKNLLDWRDISPKNVEIGVAREIK